MKIMTKTGDSGYTSLLYGGRVRKSDPRVEANGILDELSSFLGVSKSLMKDKRRKSVISGIQNDIGVLMAEIATPSASLHKLNRRISSLDVRNLGLSIKNLEKKQKSKKRAFVIPGANTLSAALDVARAVARTAERRIVPLKDKQAVKNTHILAYLNRLSDLLYLLARYYEKG